MLAFLLVMALLAIAGLAQVELDTGLKWCNGQQYKDKEYTCLDGLLCPIVWNFPYSRCGDGCYDSLYFNCSDNMLTMYLPMTKPFKLLAFNPEKLVVGSIEACGQSFHIKEGGACAYCPSQVGNSCPPDKETVLLPGAGMNTLVPGGQRYYINEFDGSLGFTQAHSGATPANATFGQLKALENGAFYVGGVDGFVSCPSLDYKIYAMLTHANAPALPADCFHLHIITVPWEGTGAAAWQYI